MQRAFPAAAAGAVVDVKDLQVQALRLCNSLRTRLMRAIQERDPNVCAILHALAHASGGQQLSKNSSLMDEDDANAHRQLLDLLAPRKVGSADHRASVNQPPRTFQRVCGNLLGARFTLLVPIKKKWTHNVLFHCHGHRAHGVGTVAHISASTRPFREMLERGWIVAMTSYRREGVVVGDAMQDVINVRQHIETVYGRIQVSVLEGRSMGGGIATLLCEQRPDLFDGAYCCGAAMQMAHDGDYVRYRNAPRRPVLFLTNESETGHIEAYIERVSRNSETEWRHHRGFPPSPEIVVPALWTVQRAGHNWVSEDERHAALDFLLNWIQHGTNITARRVMKTLPIRSRAKGWARVVSINEWGSFFLDWQKEDLLRLGLTCPGGAKGSFKLIVGPAGHKKSFDVTWSEFPHTGIMPDSWLACVHPDGQLKISVMSYSFTNAAEKAGGVEVGDFVKLTLPPKQRRRRLGRNRKTQLSTRLRTLLAQQKTRRETSKTSL